MAARGLEGLLAHGAVPHNPATPRKKIAFRSGLAKPVVETLLSGSISLRCQCFVKNCHDLSLRWVLYLQKYGFKKYSFMMMKI